MTKVIVLLVVYTLWILYLTHVAYSTLRDMGAEPKVNPIFGFVLLFIASPFLQLGRILYVIGLLLTFTPKNYIKEFWNDTRVA